MARISLRGYNREIETLIDQGGYDQAIDHCRYILKSYPKHIETYRLLGKSYLESHRYGEAADIFERVLSSVPGDFVSHVGMSIIREDEGNLDTAIWHMERAYESQPANQAIQAELSRLYGRRDGFEPPKIRLTRGALARMYFKGDLYPQAIAETRAALAEDPNRLDLQALLAETYFQAGQKVEAAETASALLKKLPFSLVANRILANILQDSERAEESKIYRQRVEALDPYETQRSDTFTSASQVNDEAIMLDMLDWQSGQSASLPASQPEWAASLGVDMEEFSATEEDGTPDWLKQVDEFKSQPEAPAEGTITGIQGEPEAGLEAIAGESAPDEVIPDWMKSAGWEPGSQEGERAEPTWDEEEVGEAAPSSEIPDWVQAMAPSDDQEADELPDTEETGDLSWLEETPSRPSDTLATWLDENAGEPAPRHEEVEGAEDELPEWLSGLSAEASAVGAESTEELPAWLEGEAEEVAQDQAVEDLEVPGELEPTALPGQSPESEAQSGPEASQPPEAEAEELPEWLSELEEPLEATAPEPEMPASFEELPAEEEIPPTAEAQLPESEPEGIELDDDEAFAWLESLAARQGADEAFLLDPSERRAEPPDWVQAAGDDLEIPFEGEEAPLEAELEPSLETEDEEIPSWLQEYGEAVEEQAEEYDLSSEELEAIEPQTEPPVEEGELFEGTPQETVFSFPIDEEKPEAEAAEAFSPPAEAASPDDWEAEPAALEEPPQELAELSPPETEQEEWLEIEEPPVITGDTKPTSPLRAYDSDMLPDWLQGLEEGEAEELSDEMSAAGVEADDEVAVPAWLQELAEEVEAPASGEEETAADTYLEEQAEPTGELPAWLSSLAPEDEETRAIESTAEVSAVETAEIEAAPGDEPPYATLEEERELESGAEAATSELEGIGLEDEEAFAWLEGLAARQGADEALLLDPDKRRTEPPEWVQEEIEESLPEEEHLEEVAEPVGEVTEALAPEAESMPAEEFPVEAELEVPSPESELGAISEVEEPLPDILEEAAETAEPVPELPSWLEGIEEEVSAPPLAGEWQPLESEPPAEAMEERFPAISEGLDVNIAGLGQLERLPGVGYTRAAALMAFRETHGPIRDLSELLQVEGFDDALVASLAEHVTTGQPEPDQQAAMISEDSFEITLVQARNALAQGDQAAALEAYNRLIEYQQFLPDVITDLHEALYRFPVDIDIWQALGDAYARTDQYQEALDAYTKAEELLK